MEKKKKAVRPGQRGHYVGGEVRPDDALMEKTLNTLYVITQNQVIKDMDKVLEENDTVLAHRLCGAGNGGFFLAFSKRGTLDVPYDAVKVHVTPQGVSGVIIKKNEIK